MTGEFFPSAHGQSETLTEDLDKISLTGSRSILNQGIKLIPRIHNGYTTIQLFSA
jgi:hypothetical protein